MIHLKGHWPNESTVHKMYESCQPYTEDKRPACPLCCSVKRKVLQEWNQRRCELRIAVRRPHHHDNALSYSLWKRHKLNVLWYTQIRVSVSQSVSQSAGLCISSTFWELSSFQSRILEVKGSCFRNLVPFYEELSQPCQSVNHCHQRDDELRASCDMKLIVDWFGNCKSTSLLLSSLDRRCASNT